MVLWGQRENRNREQKPGSGSKNSINFLHREMYFLMITWKTTVSYEVINRVVIMVTGQSGSRDTESGW